MRMQDRPPRKPTKRQYSSIAENGPDAAPTEIAELAADLFDTPIVIISWFDPQQQWFAFRNGDWPSETLRQIRLWAEEVLQKDPMIILDAIQDARSRGSPLLGSEPSIRFYAGVPLLDSGERLRGTLSILDPAPRSEFSLREIAILQRLARTAAKVLETQQGLVETFQGSTEWFRAVAELIPMELVVSRVSDGRILYGNPRLAEAFGVEPDELRHRTTLELYSNAEDRQRLVAMFRKYGEIRNFEFAFRRPKDDSLQWRLTSGRLIRFGGENAFVAISADITERKRIEDALRESEERLRIVTEAAELGSYDVDMASRRHIWSKRMKAMFGVAADTQVTDELFWSLIHPDDRERVRAAVAQSRDPKGTGNFAAEYRIRRPDGTIRWISGRGRAYFDNETAVRCAGMVQDVTERRCLEEALREREERLRLAMEAGDLGAWDADLISGQAVLSERLREIYGWPFDQPISHEYFLTSIHPADRPRQEEALAKAYDPQGNGEYALEYRIIRPDGNVRWLTARGRALFGEVGGIRRAVRLIGSVLDITEHRMAEVGLRDSLHQKEMLLREVHHRVRNNIQAIWGMIQVEAGRLRQNPEARDRLRAIGERLDVLGRLHHQFYRSHDIAWVDLAPYLDQLARNLTELHRRDKYVTIKVVAEPLACDLDTALPLGLIANELVANSLKHAFPNRRKGIIRIDFRRIGDNRVELAVCDNGIGMPESTGSAGIGMVIVDSLVRQVDAELRIESGQGTCTRLLLSGNHFKQVS